MKHIFKSYLLASVLLMTAGIPRLSAQSPEPFSPYGVFSPSVESYQMTRCGNLLPSLYTGAMTFSLPLMTYSDPDFTIPVSLEYSFDGYKPGQHSGTVGYGWYLDCGGVITREVRGIPDEGDLEGANNYDCMVFGWRQAGSYRDSLLLKSGDFYSIRRFQSEHVSPDRVIPMMTSYDTFSDTPMLAGKYGNDYRLYDSAPDVYHFRFLGHSGDFMMMPDGTFRVYNSDIPHGEISVTVTDSPNVSTYSIFTITMADGYSYQFESEGISRIPDTISGEDRKVKTSVNAYRLKSITAPNGRSATFSYAESQDLTISPSYAPIKDGNYLSVSTWEEYCTSGTVSDLPEVKWSVIQEGSSRLTGVSVSDKSAPVLAFHYSDAPGNEYDPSNFGQSSFASAYNPGRPKVLSSAALRGRDGLADSVSLNYFAATSGTPKTFLGSVTGMKTGTYSFEYNTAGVTFPKNDTQGVDHWGYWNGASISDLREHLTNTEWIFNSDPGTQGLVYEQETLGDSTYVVVMPDPDVRSTATNLYDQMADSSKEPSFSHSHAGAMTAITYPHGGHTAITYEPNRASRRMNTWFETGTTALEPVDPNNSSASCLAGGLRVATLADSYADNHADTTRFLYTDPDNNNRASGILTSMPKYSETLPYVHYANSIAGPTNISALFSAVVIGFNNCCGFTLERDPHVVYPTVTVRHPDGSSTEHRFTSVADAGLSDARTWTYQVGKREMCAEDWLEYEGRTPNTLLPPSIDRSGLRGKPKSTVIRTASGQELRRTEYSYGQELFTLPALAFNNIVSFALGPCTVASPQLVSTAETVRGVTARTMRSYNAYGQVKETSSVGSASGDTLRITLRYRHEAGDASAYRMLPDAAVKTGKQGNSEYLLAREKYSYYSGTPFLKTTVSAAPETLVVVTPATVFSAYAGNERTVSYTYNSAWRLTRASYPGKAWTEYGWNGTLLSDKTVNNALNRAGFYWKDLVGLTRVNDPSGSSERYDYDAKNRPYKILDSDSHAVSVFHYNLKNDNQ